MSDKKLFDEFQYIALFQQSYSEAGYDKNDPPSTGYMNSFKGFKTEKEMIEWVLNRESPRFGYPDKEYAIVKCSKVETSLEVKVIVT